MAQRGRDDGKERRRGASRSRHMATSFLVTTLLLLLAWSCTTTQSESVARSPEESPLHAAVRRHDLDAATALLAAGADVDSLQTPGYRVPPLSIASRTGDEQMARLLIANGASVNARDEVGNTPLHAAAGARAARPAMTALLLSMGADPNIRGRKGATALWYAALSGRAEIVQLLVDHRADLNVQEEVARSSLLDSAASLGHIDVVEVLLEAGADVAITSPTGTPLHSAAFAQRADVAALLLRYGAEVNAVDDNDVTPLHLAAAASAGENERTGRTATADLLLTHGARVNTVVCDRMTPLDAAVYVGDMEMADFLVRHGARSGHELLVSAGMPSIPPRDSKCW